MDPYIAVEKALDENVKKIILENAIRADPFTAGAKVADILDMYHNHDSCLSFTEPYWETNWLEIEAMIAGGVRRDIISVAAVSMGILIGAIEEPPSIIETMFPGMMGKIRYRAMYMVGEIARKAEVISEMEEAANAKS